MNGVAVLETGKTKRPKIQSLAFSEAFRDIGLHPMNAEFGAGNETRTRDPDLGKVVLYQLSYSRVVMGAIVAICKTTSTL